MNQSARLGVPEGLRGFRGLRNQQGKVAILTDEPFRADLNFSDPFASTD